MPTNPLNARLYGPEQLRRVLLWCQIALMLSVLLSISLAVMLVAMFATERRLTNEARVLQGRLDRAEAKIGSEQTEIIKRAEENAHLRIELTTAQMEITKMESDRQSSTSPAR